MTRSENLEHVIFDLDGTLAKSKAEMSLEMTAALAALSRTYGVGVISGGSLLQFKKQFLPPLEQSRDVRLSALTLMPTSGAAMYRRNGGGWELIYEHTISDADSTAIIDALFESARKAGVTLGPAHGEYIEHRGSQITLSCCGQEAPLEIKEAWDPDKEKRSRILRELQPQLPKGYQASYGGTTSVDVTKAGIDKAFGISRYRELWDDVPVSRILFVGDALGPGGNDAPARTTGVHCQPVASPEDTLTLVRSLL